MFGKLIAAFKKAMTWVKTIPSEPSGNGSTSRVIALAVTGTVTGLLISFFCVHHDLPTADQLYGLSTILGTGVGGYIANRLRRSDGDQQNPNQNQNPNGQGGGNA